MQARAAAPEETRTRRLAFLTWAFVALGIALRLFRYGMNFPLWGDESFVAVNFIARGYRALLNPLEYGQICPVLFLWVERYVVNHLGFNEAALRLFPLVCAVLSVWLFRHVAGRVVQGLPLLLAVAVFAVSFHPLRHAAEVKPYASDLFAALVLLALALQWLETPGRALWLWLLAAVVPLALALSHPAVFVAGGVSLSLAVPVWKEKRWRIWLPYLAFQLTAAVTFLGLYALCTRFQEQLALDGLRSYWAASFPPRNDPVRLLSWLIEVHTGTMLAYPGGGRGGLSSATLLAVLAGSVWLGRSGRRSVVVMLLAPFALTFAAALLRRYPYGIEARQMQFVAPAICLLTGTGAAALVQAVPWPRTRRAAAAIALLGLAGFAVATVIGDRKRPYRFPYDQQTREFARRFWPEQARTAELACLCADFGVDDRRAHHLRTALYLCNQWIYSPQRQTSPSRGPRWDALSSQRPLRCVLDPGTSPDQPQVVDWLARMQRTFVLRRVDRVVAAPPPPGAAADPNPTADRLLVYEFVPRPGSPSIIPAPVIAGQGLRTGRLLR